MDAYTADFISLASSRMVRQAVRQQPAYRPPQNEGMFSQLLDRLFQAEHDEAPRKTRSYRSSLHEE